MIERYAAMIRALLDVPGTNRHYSSGRPIDFLLAAYSLRDAVPAPADRPTPTPSSDTERLAYRAWSALAFREDNAANLFHLVAQSQAASGSFTTASPSTNLETYWYWELVLLHALTTYALQTRSTPLLDAAKRAALYHLQETQPDHATTEPWALNAFLLSPDTYPLADQVLHTLQIQHPTGIPNIARNLLRDTLRGLGQQV